MMREKKMVEVLNELLRLDKGVHLSPCGFHGVLIDEAFKSLSNREGYDNISTTVDFKEKKITIYTSLESHHNGDSYSEKQEKVPWKNLKLLEPYLEVAVLKLMQERIAAEKADNDLFEAKQRARRFMGYAEPQPDHFGH